MEFSTHDYTEKLCYRCRTLLYVTSCYLVIGFNRLLGYWSVNYVHMHMLARLL
jgi:hypothetical protein